MRVLRVLKMLRMLRTDVEDRDVDVEDRDFRGDCLEALRHMTRKRGDVGIVEAAINAHGNAGLHDYFKVSHEQLMHLTKVVAGKITKLQRKSLGALITIDVHARDVVGQMRDDGVSSITEFAWISQLRYELCNEKHPQLEEQKKKGTSPGSSPRPG